MAEQSKEITFRDIIRKLKEWFFYLRSKWYWLVIAGIVCGGIGVLYAWTAKPVYKASLTFILSSTSHSSGGIYGLANQFGLDLGTGGTDAFSGDNIISLMKSRTMVQKALLFKPKEHNESLINVITNHLKMPDGWKENERTKNAYPFPASETAFTPVQDSLFREMYTIIIENYLSVSRPDDDISVYLVITNSTHELFSFYLTKYLVEVTSTFYIETKTSVARTNLAMLTNEADSLRSVLSGSISSAAKVYDYTFNINPALQAQRAPAQEGQVRANALGTAYSEVLRNLELAKINLQKETPLYQVLDQPQLPLIAEKPGRLISLIIGGFLGVSVVIAFLLIRKELLHYW